MSFACSQGRRRGRDNESGKMASDEDVNMSDEVEVSHSLSGLVII